MTDELPGDAPGDDPSDDPGDDPVSARVRTLLAATDLGPGPAFDVPAIIRAGRRRRRWSTVGGSAAAVVLLLVTGTVGIHLVGRSGPPSVSSPAASLPEAQLAFVGKQVRGIVHDNGGTVTAVDAYVTTWDKVKGEYLPGDQPAQASLSPSTAVTVYVISGDLRVQFSAPAGFNDVAVAEIYAFAGTAATPVDSALATTKADTVKSYVPPTMPGHHIHLDPSTLP